MRMKSIGPAIVVLLVAGCSDPVPPWLLDTGNSDTGRDILDVIHRDTNTDTVKDVPRDIPDSYKDIVQDVGIDTASHDAITDPGQPDIADTWDTWADYGPDSDAGSDADVNDIHEIGPIDIATDPGWQCERAEDCIPPANLGQCEKMACIDHACVRDNVIDLTGCNDGSLCTTGDRCVGGVCLGDTIDCNDNNVCTTDYCVPSLGCATSAKNNIACDDLDPCTLNDRCNAKVCSGTAMSCSTPPAAECAGDGLSLLTWSLPGQCDNGSCAYRLTTTPCPDGCVDAACIVNPCSGVVCDTPPGPCWKTAGQCVGGTCEYQYDNTLTCTDGDACTTDQCSAGSCVSTPIVCNTAPAAECTGDGTGLITFSAPGSCQAGDCVYEQTTLPCNGGCNAGHCINDPCLGVDCSVPPVQCHSAPGYCLEGECYWTPDDTMDCTDGNACTDGDFCLEGNCQPGPDADCVDNDLCTTDSCDPATGCIFDWIGDECEDYNPCTLNTCEPLVGCYFPFNNEPCSDDDPCTVGDTCQGGTCVPGPNDDCDDTNVCTTDSCNSAVGCQNEFNTDMCRPAECAGSVLKQTAYCSEGECQYPADVDCEDGNACTIDTCDPVLGCGRSFSTASCDDANACTTNDRCQGGACAGTPILCNQPPADYCLDPMTVVRHSASVVCVAGNCDYAPTQYVCSFGCTDGACAGDPCEGVVCDNLTNPCLSRNGSCNNGDCIFDPVDNVPCDTDSSICTTERCQGGACVFESNLSCDDGDVCTDDVCNPTEGCQTTFNTASCDDSDSCTLTDRCSGGNCAGTQMPCDQPPQDECSGDTAVHFAPGPCVNGACEWVLTNEPCEFGCVGGLCNPDPCAGVTCEVFNGPCQGNGRCVDGGCVWDPLSGVSCDLDSSICTSDYCDNGSCTAGPAMNCTGDNPCLDYWCDPIEGCLDAANTANCDDNNACTENDSCLFGECQPGTDRDCGDTNQCTDNWCDSSLGCQIADNTAACDDGNPCTYNDQCSAGHCAAVAYTCDDLPCATRGCNGSGGCVDVIQDGWCLIDGSCFLDMTANPLNECQNCQPSLVNDAWTDRIGSCDDGDPCTVTDSCVEGACTGTGEMPCDDGRLCTSDWCEPGVGCRSENRTGSCDDGNACTENDTCSDGDCLGLPLDCGESTECLRQWCEPSVGCQSEELTGSCDDGDPCTIGDTCSMGMCMTSGNMNCNDNKPCTSDSCVDGNCVNTARPNLTPCDDNNPCTLNDRCMNGYCFGDGPNCDDENECTDDSCNPETQECVNTPNTNPCNDNNACTTNDVCGNEVCAGQPIICDDNNVCTDNQCLPATGCSFPAVSGPCDDGDLCTENDFCFEKRCTPGTAVNCDDNNVCSQDSCYPSTGCAYAAVAGTCDDNDACTYGDHCFDMTCLGFDISCEPALPCTTAECNGTSSCSEGLLAGWCVIDGACQVDQAPSPTNPCVYCDANLDPNSWSYTYGNPCDDGDACTSGDYCSGGECVGTSYSCNDELACTADACRGDGFCDHLTLAGWCVIEDTCWSDGQTPAGNPCLVCDSSQKQDSWSFTAADCSDNNECTVDDICASGSCQPGDTRVCNDNNVCTEDSCIGTKAGGCEFVPVTAICAQPYCDGLTFHAASMCSGTTCPDQVLTNCDDGNQCTVDQCTTGGCINTFQTGSCDDGNPCTAGDTCLETGCMGTPYTCEPSGECVQSSSCNGDGTCSETPFGYGQPCSSDSNPCTGDFCDGFGTCTHTALEDGTICDDNNLCTSGGTCSGGVCSDGNDVLCTAIDDCHVAGECDPLTGNCSNPAAPDGTDCDDGDPCTLDDVCSQGECAGPRPFECPEVQCQGPGTCNSTTGECSYVPLADGDPCDDMNPCTQRDVCSRGECRGLDPIDCSPVDTCHYTGTCNPATGLCDWPARPDGTTCDDSNACTSGTTCTDGVCTNGTSTYCPPVNNCHFEGVCDPSTGICSQPKKDDGTLCTDSNACSFNDQCLNGVCGGTTYTCNDSRSCTTDTCLGDGQCTFTVNTNYCLIDSYCRPQGQTNPLNMCQVCNHEMLDSGWSPNEGAPCNDQLSNTKNDICVGTTCQGTPYDCSDNLDCTEDICDGLGGANHYVMTGYCVIDGACFANSAVNPLNPCQKCSTSIKNDSWSNVNDGVVCDDGEACSYHDTCQSGVCTGTAYSCDDGLDCTITSCRGDGMCDGSLVEGWCLIWDTCVAENSTNPTNICQQCLSTVSPTAWSPANQGSPCDDNNPATTDDTCVDGACIGVGESCVDGLDCTDDIYTGSGCENPILPGWCLINGSCAWDGDINHTNKCQICTPSLSQTSWSGNNGSVCSDNNPCTYDDICIGQACSGTQMQCDDGVTCTIDGCSEGVCTAEIAPGWCLISGTCVTEGTINPTNSCDICAPAALKVNWSSNDGVACDDMNLCTYDDSCVSRVCRGRDYSCDDARSCTLDYCDGAGQCGHDVIDGWCLIDGNCIEEGVTNLWNSCRICDSSANPVDWSDNDGAVCDDLDACTFPDLCGGSLCIGNPAGCDDGLICTTQTCDGIGGCSEAVLSPGWCLIEGACYQNRQIDPSNPCRICKTELRTDDWSFRNGVACDDENACSVFDTCGEGVCAGTPYVCDAYPFCIEEICDGNGGCAMTGMVSGTCLIDGTCYHDEDVDPQNECLECDGWLLQTDWSPLTGTACNDGQDCTFGDTCQSGSCGGTAHPCDDGLDCTDNVCDGNGGCSYPISTYSCLIDGICRADGEPHPTTACTVCAPRISQDTWTQQNTSDPEVCNGADDNCDGITDPENAPGCEYYFIDMDNDGAGTGSAYRCLCAPDGNWRSKTSGDCDDGDATAYPGNSENCGDSIDNDCDGDTDEQGATGCTVYYVDIDGDEFGQPGTQRCLCAGAAGLATAGGDCDDSSTYVNPSRNDFCNGVDDDCDGTTDPDGATGCVDRFRDEDSDTYGAEPPICMCGPRGVYTAIIGGDCNDLDGTVNPPGVESCNGVDDNCDGSTDNGAPEDLCPLPGELIPHGTAACVSGRCAMVCQDWVEDPPQKAWHDVDNEYITGCECEADSYEQYDNSSCATAFNLGTLPDDGSQLTVTGNLPSSGAEDWYSVTMSDATWNAEYGYVDRFHARILLETFPTDEFEIAVVEGSCSNDFACASGSEYDWAVDFWTSTLGENPCSVRGNYCPNGNPTDYQECIRVTGDAQKCNSCPAVALPGHHACTDNSRTLLIRVVRHDGLPVSCQNYSMTVSNGIQE